MNKSYSFYPHHERIYSVDYVFAWLKIYKNIDSTGHIFQIAGGDISPLSTPPPSSGFAPGCYDVI
jgi:hypothetical protein